MYFLSDVSTETLTRSPSTYIFDYFSGNLNNYFPSLIPWSRSCVAHKFLSFVNFYVYKMDIDTSRYIKIFMWYCIRILLKNTKKYNFVIHYSLHTTNIKCVFFFLLLSNFNTRIIKSIFVQLSFQLFVNWNIQCIINTRRFFSRLQPLNICISNGRLMHLNSNSSNLYY